MIPNIPLDSPLKLLNVMSTQYDYSFLLSIQKKKKKIRLFIYGMNHDIQYSLVSVKVKLCTCPPCSLHKHNLPLQSILSIFGVPAKFMTFQLISKDVFSSCFTGQGGVSQMVSSLQDQSLFPKKKKKNQLSYSLNVLSDGNHDKGSYISYFVPQKTS
jgi:hypothetical protein